jgi:transposase-like protein
MMGALTSSKTLESGAERSASGGGLPAPTPRERRRLDEYQEREVTRLYAATETPVSEISRRFGIAESSVYRVAQRHGAAKRGPRAAVSSASAAAKSTTGSAGRSAATSGTNGGGTGLRVGQAQTSGRLAPAGSKTATRQTQRTRAGAVPVARREFRVSYVAVRVFVAASIADALRQAEAAGATDITGIQRGATGTMDITDSRQGSDNEAVVAATRRQRLARADQG